MVFETSGKEKLLLSSHFPETQIEENPTCSFLVQTESNVKSLENFKLVFLASVASILENKFQVDKKKGSEY